MSKNKWPNWEIFIRDGCVCQYCGFKGTEFTAWRNLELGTDHLVPRSGGGPDSAANKVVACKYCNLTKGRYNPAKGEPPGLDSPAYRALLIAKAKRYIEQKSVEKEEAADFALMMREIEALKSAPASSQ